MAEDRKIAIGIGLTAIIAGLIYATKAKEVLQEIPLSAGSNRVIYTGKEQLASDALASIMDYLVIALYWNPDVQYWEQVMGDTVMVPNGLYSIKVSEDCIWVF